MTKIKWKNLCHASCRIDITIYIIITSIAYGEFSPIRSIKSYLIVSWFDNIKLIITVIIASGSSNGCAIRTLQNYLYTPDTWLSLILQTIAVSIFKYSVADSTQLIATNVDSIDNFVCSNGNWIGNAV